MVIDGDDTLLITERYNQGKDAYLISYVKGFSLRIFLIFLYAESFRRPKSDTAAHPFLSFSFLWVSWSPYPLLRPTSMFHTFLSTLLRPVVTFLTAAPSYALSLRSCTAIFLRSFHPHQYQSVLSVHFILHYTVLPMSSSISYGHTCPMSPDYGFSPTTG